LPAHDLRLPPVARLYGKTAAAHINLARLRPRPGLRQGLFQRHFELVLDGACITGLMANHQHGSQPVLHGFPLSAGAQLNDLPWFRHRLRLGTRNKQKSNRCSGGLSDTLHGKPSLLSETLRGVCTQKRPFKPRRTWNAGTLSQNL
jgi:hypothetical protein